MHSEQKLIKRPVASVHATDAQADAAGRVLQSSYRAGSAAGAPIRLPEHVQRAAFDTVG
jgi:hypothetical protein